MTSTELKVNITVEEVLAGEATGEHFTLQMEGVISPLLTGKPNELQVYIAFIKNKGIKTSCILFFNLYVS